MQFRYYKTIFPKLKKLKKVCSAESAINFLLLKVSLKIAQSDNVSLDAVSADMIFITFFNKRAML